MTATLDRDLEPVTGRTEPMIVVPCYNEELRLDPTRFLALARSGRVRILFVNDGSTDDTVGVIREMTQVCDRIDLLDLPRNMGKAEAVRRGLVAAIGNGATVVGYYDADLATPPHELLRLVDVLDARPDIEFVLGARVALLGQSIERTTHRHVLGRVFAGMASAALGLRIYDTQCGAKLFRVTPTVEAAIRTPFRSSWGFDVELLGRLLAGTRGSRPIPKDAFAEVPLREWSDVQGSRLTTSGMIGAFTNVVAVAAERRIGRSKWTATEHHDKVIDLTVHERTRSRR
jgi:dolichyl-phosphate beta-glucosyltransferase